MPHLVTFQSSHFDPSAEPENPINPIAGHALLHWLAEAMRAGGYATGGDPEPEDWGWYVSATSGGATYLVGASGEPDADAGGPIEWNIQIHRQRSLGDKLLGRNAHADDDALTALIERAVRAAPWASDVEVQRA
jgi:hypothetical protein